MQSGLKCISHFMMMTKNRSKVAVTLVTAILLVILYVIIFSFSEQDGEESGSLSHMISEECVEMLREVAGRDWSVDFCRELSDYLEHPIRKMAHFSEYACMGILVYVLWRQWRKRDRKLCGVVICWVLLSAIGDEIHQLFVPGRWGSVADVLLDTCGGVFGLLICLFVEYVQNRIKLKRMADVV